MKKPGFSVGGGRVDLDCWYSLDMVGKTRPYSKPIQNQSFPISNLKSQISNGMSYKLGILSQRLFYKIYPEKY
jgi:hypothetical protein